MQTEQGIKLGFLFHGDLVLDMPQNVGTGPHGNRQVLRVVSGTVEGPRLQGTTMPMSGDWLLLRGDGCGELDVRSTIQTSDNALIYMHYRGLMHARPEIMGAMFQGQPIDPSDLYLRVAAYFETSSPKYDWINKTLGLGTATVALPKFNLYMYAVE
jgi:uncharacterized protein DUF3237